MEAGIGHSFMAQAINMRCPRDGRGPHVRTAALQLPQT
jgi:hypothetical protein